MKIIINGQPKSYLEQSETPLTLYHVLATEEMANMKVAVAHNGAFIPKTNYKTQTVQDGDSIEIVSPMQGG